MLAGRTLMLIVLVLLLADPIQSEFKYMAQCNYDATKGFSTTVVVEKAASDNIYQITALSPTKTITDGCVISPVTGTNDAYSSTITVDTAGTFNPTSCGNVFELIDNDSDGSKDEVTFAFLIQTTNGFVFNTDVIFKWKCTTADHNNVIIQNFTIASSPENDLSLKSQLALEVYDSADQVISPGSVLTLGGSYYLKLKHIYANSKNKQVGIYVNTLTFYEGVDSSSVPHVVAINKGCKQTSTAYGLTQNFVKDVSSTDPTGGSDGVYVIKSGTFETALWMKLTGISTNLKIEAVVVQCLFNNQSKCEDPETNVCVSGRRRRRNTDDTSLKNVTSVGTSFTISLVGGNANQGSGKNDGNGTMESCYQTYTFWILLLVFGILMMFCLIFSVYLFFRLRREKKSRRMIEEKYGVLNPAF